MALVLTFLLGIANFAMHKAMLESRHPLLARLGWRANTLAGRVGLGMEFGVLLAALMLAANGLAWALGAYLAYSLLNAASAWLLLSGRG